MQSGVALASALKHLMVEKCCPAHLAIFLRVMFSLIWVRSVALFTSYNHLAGMRENTEKNDEGQMKVGENGYEVMLRGHVIKCP